MKRHLFIVMVLTLFVLSEARPRVVTQREIEQKQSVNAKENHVRVRRRNFDYDDFMSKFWENVDGCTNCNTLNVGNGYKNRNTVHLSTGQKPRNHNNYSGMLNIGNGRGNTNKVFFGTGQNSPNQDTVNIGNGSKNTNTVYFGTRPGSSDEDPFTGSFWED